MVSLLILLFIYIFTLDYLIESTHVIPKLFGWAPEIISGIAFLAFCMLYAKNRVLILPARYVIFFILFILFLAIGIIVNQVQPGAIFSGVRKYFRYAPFFLIPLVYNFSDKEVSKLIKVLLFFSFLQLPVAVYQKLVVFKLYPTGDVIEGTVNGSGKLAVYLICSISMALAYYLKERISFYIAFLFIIILLLPVGITEASASIFLLPLAFMVPIIFINNSQNKKQVLIPAIVFTFVSIVGFVIIYNLQYADRWDGNILNAIFENKATESIYKGATEDSTTDIPGHAMREVGRVDSMLLPIKILSKKGDAVLYGVGIGNAIPAFSKILEGEYSRVTEEYGADFTTVSFFLWEIGVIGVIFSYLLLLMIFLDALKLRYAQDISGVIAHGWLGVTAVIAASMIYTNLLGHNVIGYLWWFFSGYIISKTSLINPILK